MQGLQDGSRKRQPALGCRNPTKAYKVTNYFCNSNVRTSKKNQSLLNKQIHLSSKL